MTEREHSDPEHDDMGTGGSVRSTGYLLWQVVNLWQRRQKKALSPFNLTPVQFLLLAGLDDLSGNAPESITQTALARHCGTDRMMTSQVLRHLEGDGLIHRREHDGDGRAMAVEIGEAGRDLVRRAATSVAQVETAFFQALGPDVPAFGDALTVLSGERPRRRVPAGSRSS
jgi:DNA-binding MarR family transcriptional regulator